MRKVSLILGLIAAPLLMASHVTTNAWQQESIASTAAAAAASGTQEAITITVTNGTSFTATPNLWLKQSDVQVVGTLNQALAQLPKTINHTVTINMGAGTDASATVSGFSGAGSITINGTLAVTAFGGNDTGTCNAATTTTCTPTAPGWTASEALGSLVEFTDVGVGTLAYRSPTIQTTGVMTFLAVSFLNANDTYRIVAPSSIITALTIKQNSVPITFNYMKIAGLTQNGNRDVTYQACQFSAAATTSTNNMLETYTNSVFTAASAPTWNDAAKIVFTNTVLHASNATVTGARRITGDIVALATTTSPALSLTEVDQIVLGMDAKNCTYSPLALTDIGFFRVSSTGIGLTGTSNTGTHGIVMLGRGSLHYTSTPTLTGGTSDMSINTTNTTYANMAGSENMLPGWRVQTQNLTASGILNRTGLFNVGTLTASGALVMSSTSSQSANTTFNFNSTPAGGTVNITPGLATSYAAVSGAGTVIGDATAANLATNIFITGGATNSGLLLPAPSLTPSRVQDYINKSGNTILVYPSSGSTQINALGVGNPYSLTDGSAIRVYPVSTTLYYVIALN